MAIYFLDVETSMHVCMYVASDLLCIILKTRCQCLVSCAAISDVPLRFSMELHSELIGDIQYLYISTLLI